MILCVMWEERFVLSAARAGARRVRSAECEGQDTLVSENSYERSGACPMHDLSPRHPRFARFSGHLPLRVPLRSASVAVRGGPRNGAGGAGGR